MPQRYDLAVIGGGSGGFASALAAARMGLSVVVIEKGDCLGGNAVRGGVNCWEAVAGATGIPFDLYCRLRTMPRAAAVCSFGRHVCWYQPGRDPIKYPGGEHVIDPARNYLDTLQRHGCPEGGLPANELWVREHWHAIPFEPGIMAQVMLQMLAETGRAIVLLSTRFTDVSTEADASGHRRVASIALEDGRRIVADAYVDGTADALVCVAAGCREMVGQEPASQFGEPGAPPQANRRINGVSLIFRVTPRGATEEALIEPLAQGVPATCWWRPSFPYACVNQYPSGDWNINMLPTMEGGEFLELGYPRAYDQCLRRVRAFWHHLQTTVAEFQRCRLTWIAPALGVRESRRIVGEYVLTQHDLLAGLSRQQHDDIICLSDHSMDTHGQSTGRAGCGEVREPYGVPFRCLVPEGFLNLLVACRGASFSSIAASSCRLSRTMMQLGQAAGAAAAIAGKLSVPVARCPAAPLRAVLREQHVQLEHPMPPELRQHLSQHDPRDATKVS